MVPRKAHGTACLKTSRNLYRRADYQRATEELMGHIYLIFPVIFTTPAGGTQGINWIREHGKSTPELSGWKCFWGVTIPSGIVCLKTIIFLSTSFKVFHTGRWNIFQPQFPLPLLHTELAFIVCKHPNLLHLPQGQVPENKAIHYLAISPVLLRKWVFQCSFLRFASVGSARRKGKEIVF